jgi:putative FmdB family regulatory protein
MPIYEYRCSACGHELEALQKITDAPLSSCPACHADKLTKLVSAAGFQLKGSGWYATDFRNGGKPAAKTNGAAAKPDAAGDSKPADGKADTKSETKSEAAAAPASCGTGCACH